jgi:DNA-binding NarL/FixJ family response regulator
MEEPIMRVLLITSRPQARIALRHLLEMDPELYLVSEVSETDGLMLQVHDTRPDLVLLDWEQSDVEAADLILGLQSLRRPPAVVAFGECIEARYEALEAGADAFVSRDEPAEWMLDALYRIGRLSPVVVA